MRLWKESSNPYTPETPLFILNTDYIIYVIVSIY